MRFHKFIHLLYLSIFFFFPFIGESQSIAFNGYVKDMQTLYYPTDTFENLAYNYIHNRLNFEWFTNDNLALKIEGRNRLYLGKDFKRYPELVDMVEIDNGFVDLSWNWASGNSWFINTYIDRFYLDYTSGKWNVRVGRQRINWGINLVWNPNDIFNSFSFFDFDYEERPGIDGVKIQYYTGVTSSAEIIYQAAESTASKALAGMFRFSHWDYDFQFIGGKKGYDWIIGMGWAGDIRGGGFRGEITHFEPLENDKDKSERATVISVSGDYTFKNSLFVHAGALFNSHGKAGPAGGTNLLMNTNLSSKYLSMGRYALFGQLSYPFTPLFNGDISGMLNPSDHSFFIGPALTYSLVENLDLMISGQFFEGKSGTEFGEIGFATYLRLKWSF